MTLSHAPEAPSPPPPPEAPAVSGPAIWGPWATLGLGLAVMLVFLLGQLIPIGLGYFVRSWWDPANTDKPVLQAMALDGDILGAATVTGGSLGVLLIVLLAVARGFNPARYLQLKSFVWWHLPLWLVATYVAGVVQTTLAPVFHRDPIPQFMLDTFQSTNHPVLLAVGIVVIAPLFEELFFRGFLHEGWRRSRFGVLPGVLLTTLLWTFIHLQYGWFDKSWIFGFGLLLCLAREWSGSLWAPIAMHVVNNGLSLIATALELT